MSRAWLEKLRAAAGDPAAMRRIALDIPLRRSWIARTARVEIL